MSSVAIHQIDITKVDSVGYVRMQDKVAVEEPLEIQIEYGNEDARMLKQLAVTMRTPGNDDELSVGFLFTEGIVKHPDEIMQLCNIGDYGNIIRVMLQPGMEYNLSTANRNFYTTSSCGVCGKASIDAIRTVSQFTFTDDIFFIPASVLFKLQNTLREQQKTFEATGGLHASALFDQDGNLILLREDVGRHNALDKLIGHIFLKGKLPLNNAILLLSGRASFELIQKSVMAGVRIVAAVGAPSSLAVELARENDLTLIGFLKNDRFNVYSGMHRIVVSNNLEHDSVGKKI